MQHPEAAAAASRAMRSSQSPSRDSRGSYDRLGGPASFAIPRRRHGAGLHSSCESPSIDQQNSTPVTAGTPRPFKEGSGRIDQVDYFGDPAALSPITEPNGLDGRNSSVPSSYRRLRKAKSMFTTRHRTAQAPSDAPALPYGDSLDPERSPGFQLPRTMKRSISFRRGNHQSTQGDRNSQNSDAAVEMARSQFEKDQGDRGLRTHKSTFSLRRKREHKPFRKTFRDTSDYSVSPATPAGLSIGGSLNSRSWSNSIKKGFKRMFGLSESVDTTAQPSPMSAGSNSVEPAVVTPSRRSMKGGSPREDTVPADSIEPQWFRTIVQSHSGNSLCDSKSRVTSWADSSLTNTVTARKPGHRQSLSSIGEDENLDQQVPRTPSPTMNDKENQVPSGRKSNPNRRGIVDSQDLYSALVQQMHRNMRFEPDEDLGFGRVPERRVVPEMPGSGHSQYGRRTVRRVPSEEASISPDSFATARGEQSSAQKYHLRPAKSLKLHRSKSSKLKAQHSTDFSENISSPPAYAPSEDSDDNSGSLMVPRLRDANRDVGSPSVYSGIGSGKRLCRANIVDDSGSLIIPRVRESRMNADSPNVYSGISSGNAPPSVDMVDGSGNRNVARVRDLKRDDSPSVYSRTSSGNTLPRPDVVDDSSHGESGTATIYAQERTTAYISPMRAAQDPPSNHLNPRADWHRWISSEFERIEQTKPTREHIREYEQFHNDDEQLTNIAREAHDAVSTPTQIFNVPVPNSSAGKEHTEEELPLRRNFSRLFLQPSSGESDLPLQQDLTGNTPRDYARAPAIDLTIDPDEPASPMSILRARLQNQSPMGLRSRLLQQPPDTPTPKGVDTRQIWAQEQQRRYAARRRAAIAEEERYAARRRAAIAEEVRSVRMGQQQWLNNENRRQPDGFSAMLENYHKTAKSSNDLVESFLDSRRGQQGSSSDTNAATDAFL
jgi:hypothetical protein